MKISIIVEAVRNHICKWKDTYEVLGVVTAFAVSTLALVQSTIILRLQSKEFHLRNRPYVVLTNPRFDGAGVDTARQTYPHTVDIETHNISEVPATQIKTLADIFINGIRVWGTVYPSTALTKADPKTDLPPRLTPLSMLLLLLASSQPEGGGA